MIDPQAKLRDDLWEATEKAPTRDGFGKGVVEAGKKDMRIVVLSADLEESTRAEWFHEEFPSRYVEVGVAEQNMATVAAGMANYGKIPFIASYAAFSPGRNWEQIRTTIALNNVPVIVCGMHAGVSVGPDGATHQMLEDMALMRAMPNMTVISACDAEEARKASIAAAALGRPVYMRFGREKTPVMTTPETPFEVGKVLEVWKTETPHVAIFATGPLLYNSLLAARDLEKKGIAVSVTNVHTVKPLDPRIVEIARLSGKVVTVEEHQTTGGLGGAIAELLATHAPMPIEMIGVHDAFGQSGTPSELIEHYKMSPSAIAEAADSLVQKK